MRNETLFGAEAREKLKAGVAKTYKAIAPTLGPKGRSAILSYGKRYNSVTLDDGVSIADFLVLEDPFENEGAKLIKEVASKTNDEVGDSTTTSTVLAYSMLDNALKNITAGSNPTLIKKGMQRAVKFVVKELSKIAIPISSTEDVRKVATISANNAEMGEKVAEAVEAVKGGLVSVEEGTSLGINVEVVDGMQLSTGFAHPYFGIKSANGKSVFNNPLVAIIDRNIQSMDEIMPILQTAKQSGHPLLLICENIQQSALAMVLKNFVESRIEICVVKAPSGGVNKKELMDDVALYTGGKVFGSVFGDDIKNFKPEYLGKAEKTMVDSQFTVIRAKQDQKLIEERVKSIDVALAEAKNDPYRTEHLRLRRAGLTSGIALIKVCAKTETETKAQIAKLEDAKNAAITALKGGVVAGGGTAFMYIKHLLSEEMDANWKTMNSDESLGMSVVANALSQPLKVLAENTGLNGETVVDKVYEGLKTCSVFGFNADTETYGNLIEEGVIDAANSMKTAIENAVSVVSTVIMTETISCIIEDEEKK